MKANTRLLLKVLVLENDFRKIYFHLLCLFISVINQQKQKLAQQQAIVQQAIQTQTSQLQQQQQQQPPPSQQVAAAAAAGIPWPPPPQQQQPPPPVITGAGAPPPPVIPGAGAPRPPVVSSAPPTVVPPATGPGPSAPVTLPGNMPQLPNISQLQVTDALILFDVLFFVNFGIWCFILCELWYFGVEILRSSVACRMHREHDGLFRQNLNGNCTGNGTRTNIIPKYGYRYSTSCSVKTSMQYYGSQFCSGHGPGPVEVLSE